MPRLVQVSETGLNDEIYAAAKDVCLNTANVKTLVDLPTPADGCKIVYRRFNQSKQETRQTATIRATLNTAINVANTTNSVSDIPVTVINDDASTYVKTVKVADIVTVYDYPTDNTDALLTIANENYQEKSYRTDDTQAAILALANA